MAGGPRKSVRVHLKPNKPKSLQREKQEWAEEKSRERRVFKKLIEASFLLDLVLCTDYNLK